MRISKTYIEEHEKWIADDEWDCGDEREYGDEWGCGDGEECFDGDEEHEGFFGDASKCESFCEEDHRPRRGVLNKRLGSRGEEAAVRYLKKMGYEILERNWMCPAGEADIVAQIDDSLVFVEVKTRKGVGKGFPAEAVTPEKRARYEMIAMWYLKEYNYTDIIVRFDVIALVVVAEDRAFLKHYVDAFGWEC